MSWPEEDSAHLMQRLKEGDDRAFKKIFDKYYVPLRSYAFRYVGDDSRTDNFVQDAFLIVWERKEDFQVLFALKRFLYVSVKNACLNYLKHQAVEKRNLSELTKHLESEQEEEAILEEEIHAELFQAIEGLSGQAKKVIKALMEGLSNQEIAQSLNISIHSVKTVKQRAYKALRKELSKLISFLLLFY